MAETSHFIASLCLPGAWAGLSQGGGVGGCPVFSPQFPSNVARAGARGCPGISLFTQPQGLTPWSRHTGKCRLPHSMAASGPSQQAEVSPSFLAQHMQCLFCHFLLGTSKSQTHPDSRGGGTRLHPLTIQGFRTCRMGNVSWPFGENNICLHLWPCCPLQEGVGAAEAVRAMRPPELQTQAERRCLAVELWGEMDRGEEMAVGGTRGGQIPSIPPAGQ